MKKFRPPSWQEGILRALRAGKKEALKDWELGRNLCTRPCPFWALKTPNFSFAEGLSRIACHKAPYCAS